MKKILLLITLSMLITANVAKAQETDETQNAGNITGGLRFGYFSYSSVLTAMSGYNEAKQQITTLRKQFDDELKRCEDDFNVKYEQFIEDQKLLAPSIYQKRQAELQELLEKNVVFKKEAERLLQQAENDAYQPLHQQLKETLAEVSRQQGLAFVLNTDNNTVPFINTAYGTDLTALLINKLK